MVFPTKRSIEARIRALEKDRTEGEEGGEDGDHFEVVPLAMYAREPRLTASLMLQGFVVEREHQPGGIVTLHTTPDVREIYQTVRWHTEGPAAATDEVRIAWEDNWLEAVLEEADEPAYEPPELPEEPVAVAEGEGWGAVAPADRVIENQILKRSEAEVWGYEILGSVPPWLESDFDLVEVDAEPVSSRERRPD